MLNADDVRALQFTQAWKGYEAAEVDAFRKQVQAALTDLESRLEEAGRQIEISREGEEAVKLTFAAAVRTKDEMVAKAAAFVAETEAKATSEATAKLEAAKQQATSMVAEARREAEDQRAEMRAEIKAARAAAEEEQQRIDAEIEVGALRSGYRGCEGAQAGRAGDAAPRGRGSAEPPGHGQGNREGVGGR